MLGIIQSQIWVNNSETIDVLLGDDFSINCSASDNNSFIFPKSDSCAYHDGGRYIFTNITVDCAGEYQCVVLGSVTRKIRVNVQYAPRINGNNEHNIRASLEETLVLNCSLDYGFPQATLKWFKGTSLITSFSNSSLPIQMERMDSAGVYSCRAENALGDSMKTFNVTLREFPPRWINETMDEVVTLTEGENVSLSCNVLANPAPELTWTYPQGQKVHKGNLSLIRVTMNSSGTYTCQAQNSLGIVAKKIHVKVDIRPITLIDHQTYFIRAEYNELIHLYCVFQHGFRNPNITWFLDGDSLLFNYTLEKVTPLKTRTDMFILTENMEKFGRYSCHADDKVSYVMHVLPVMKPIWRKGGYPFHLDLNEGANQTISCAAKGIPKPEISFKKVCGEWVNNSILLNNISRNCSGKYECNAYNKNGLISLKIRLHVNYPPNIVNFSVSGHSSRRLVLLDCVVDPGYPQSSITWLFNGEALQKDKSFVIYQKHNGRNWIAKLGVYIRVGDAGNYTCQVENVYGRATKTLYLKPASFTVFAKSPVKRYITVKEGADLTLFCMSAIQWEKNNTGICKFGSPKASQVSIHNVTRGCSGIYSCLSRYVREKIFIVIVIIHPIINSFFPPKVYRNIGGNFSAECSSDRHTVIHWNFDNGKFEKKIMGSVILIKNIRKKDFGTYTCKARNSVGKTKKSLELIHSPITINLSINHYGDDQLIYMDCTVDRKGEITWLFKGNNISTERKKIVIYQKNSKGNWVNTLGVFVKTDGDLGEYTCIVNGEMRQTLQVNNMGEKSISSGWNNLTITEGGDLKIFCKGNIWKTFVPGHCLYTIDTNKRHLRFTNITQDCGGLVYCSEDERQKIYNVQVLGKEKKNFQLVPKLDVGQNDSFDEDSLEASGNNSLDDSFAASDNKSLDGRELDSLDIPNKSLADNSFGDSLEESGNHPLEADDEDEGDNSFESPVKSSFLELPGGIQPTFAPKITEFPLKVITKGIGEKYEINCIVDAFPVPHIYWYLNGIRYANSNSLFRSRKDFSSVNKTILILTIPSITPDNYGTYKCHSYNQFGEDTKSWDLLPIGPIPTHTPIEYEPEITDFRSSIVNRRLDDFFKMRCIVKGFPLPTVSWLFNGTRKYENFGYYQITTTISSKSSLNLFISFPNTIKPYNYGNYTCYARNFLGTATKSWELRPLLFNISQSAPKIMEFPKVRVEKRLGDRYQINCTVSAFPPPDTAWYFDGKMIKRNVSKISIAENETILTLTIPSITIDHYGSYECRSTNIKGKDRKIWELWEDTSIPPIIQDFDSDYFTRKGGERYEIDCTVTAFPRPNIEWLYHGLRDELLYAVNEKRRPITNEMSSYVIRRYFISDTKTMLTLTIPSVDLEHYGTYKCLASNAFGSDSKTFHLTHLDPQVRYKPEIRDFEVSVVNKSLGDSFEMVCVVKGFPTPGTVWMFNGVANYPDMGVEEREEYSDNESLKLYITFPNITRRNYGKYTCNSLNELGLTEKSWELQPLLFSPKIMPFRNVEKRLGDRYQINCTVDAFPPPDTVWYYNTKPYSVGNFDMFDVRKISVSDEKSILTLTIPSVTWDHYGIYTCLSRNDKGYDSKIWELRKDPTIPPKIQEFPSQFVKKDVGERFEINCNVTAFPSPQIEWVFNETLERQFLTRKKVVSDNKTIVTLIIPSVTPRNYGRYSCHVFNSVGNDTKSWNLLPPPIQFKPEISDFQSAVVNKSLGDFFEMSCIVKGFPLPKIMWLFNESRIYEGQYYQLQEGPVSENTTSLNITFSRITSRNYGRYKCYSMNFLGSDRKSWELKPFQFAPEIVNFPLKSVKKRLGDRHQINCTVYGFPPPNTMWYHNERVLGDDLSTKLSVSENKTVLTLIIPSVKSSHYGVFKCFSSNIKGNDSKIWRLKEKKYPPRIEAFSSQLVRRGIGEKIEINCTVTAIPRPQIEWLLNGFSDTSLFNLRKNHISKRKTVLTLILPSIKKENYGTYTCHSHNELGEDTKSWNLSFPLSAPKIVDFSSSFKRVDSGDSFKVRCMVNGFPLPRVIWLFNGTQAYENIHYKVKERILSENRISLDIIFSKIKSYNYGRYTCRSVNIQGNVQSTDSKSWELAPFITPKIMNFPYTNITKRQGDRHQINCTVHAYPPPVTNWYFDGIPVEQLEFFDVQKISVSENKTVFTLIIPNININNYGMYQCYSHNIKGNDTKVWRLLKDTTTAPKIKYPKSLFVRKDIGDFLDITCSVTGFPLPGVVWMFNGTTEYEGKYYIVDTQPARNEIVSSIYVHKIRSHNYGIYQCSANNSRGTAIKSWELAPLLKPKIMKFPSEFFRKGPSERFEINCTVYGFPLPYTTWYFKNKTLNNVKEIQVSENKTILTLIIPSITSKDYGTYVCHSSNIKGADIKLWEMYPPIESPRLYFRMIEGSSLILTCTLTNRPIVWGAPFGTDYCFTKHSTNLYFSNITHDCISQYYCDDSKEVIIFQVDVFDSPKNLITTTRTPDLITAKDPSSSKSPTSTHSTPDLITLKDLKRSSSESFTSTHSTPDVITAKDLISSTPKSPTSTHSTPDLITPKDLISSSLKSHTSFKSHHVYYQMIEGSSLTLTCTLRNRPIVWGLLSGKNHCFTTFATYLFIKNITRDCATDYFCDDTKQKIIFHVDVYDSPKTTKDPSSPTPDLITYKNLISLISSDTPQTSSPKSSTIKPKSPTKKVDDFFSVILEKENRSIGSTLYHSLIIYMYLSGCLMISLLKYSCVVLV